MHWALIKFSDDSKGLHCVVREEEASQLQKYLADLNLWSQEWQMLYIPDSCHVLHFGTTNPRTVYTVFNYPLLPVDKEKYIGVSISISGTPSRQVSATPIYQTLQTICAPTTGILRPALVTVAPA